MVGGYGLVAQKGRKWYVVCRGCDGRYLVKLG